MKTRYETELDRFLAYCEPMTPAEREKAEAAWSRTFFAARARLDDAWSNFFEAIKASLPTCIGRRL